MNTNKLMHLELFKEVDKRGKSLAYCFVFVDAGGKVHFASFEHRKLNDKYMNEIVRRGNFVFDREETQKLEARSWRDKVEVYTNVPNVYKQDEIYRQSRRKLLESRELDRIIRFIRNYESGNAK